MLNYKKSLFILFILIIFSSSCSGKSGKKLFEKTLPEIESPGDYRMDILEDITMNLPEDIRMGILSNVDNFISDLRGIQNIPMDLFIQADKTHSIGPEYKPEDIVLLNEYPELTLSRDTLSLRQIILPDLIKMVEDARKEGLTLVISSTYRSYDYQDKLFNWNVEQNGLETAERESARPGTSQHQLGTVIDFGSITDEYAFTPEGEWLLYNAWKYGFSLSYPDGYEDLTGYRYECWHFRYISPEAAKLQKDYFNDIQYYLLAFLNEHKEELKSLL